jgi:NADPH:quinone reductase-like Zn-dependent oxidoreductase
VALNLASGSRDAALAAVQAGGVMISLGEGADAVTAAAEAAAVRLEATHVHTNRDWLKHVGALATEGVLKPTVSQVFDLSDAAEAHRAIEGGHTQGKVVLRA